MNPLINIAIRAARKAGDLIARSVDRSEAFRVTEKLTNDFVTEIDKQAELIIIDTIKRAYPDHSIIAEETGHTEGNEYSWIIDPLDGTANFIHKIPHIAISIAIQHKAKTIAGVIYDPLRNELFTGANGEGAKLNDHRIRVSKVRKFKQSLLATGLPFRARNRLDNYFTSFKKIYKQVSDVRRMGTASLDLAYVACGRLDGYWEMSLCPWDIAAGALIVQEAGGFVSDFNGEENYLKSGDIVCGNANVHQALLKGLE